MSLELQASTAEHAASSEARLEYYYAPKIRSCCTRWELSRSTGPYVDDITGNLTSNSSLINAVREFKAYTGKGTEYLPVGTGRLASSSTSNAPMYSTYLKTMLGPQRNKVKKQHRCCHLVY